MRALILNQISYSDSGHVGSALGRREIQENLFYRETLDWDNVDLEGYGLVVLLGSMWSPLAGDNPAVAAEVDLILKAYRASIPVLGVCYGGQLMAKAGGGSLYLLDESCVGYRPVLTNDKAFPNGNQFFWNHIGFSLPDDSSILAAGPHSCWAFECSGGIALQFHVDATPQILKRWTAEGTDELTSLGLMSEPIILEAERVSHDVNRFCDVLLTRLLGPK